jgi:hypothetical protein
MTEEDTARFRAALIKIGLKPGDRMYAQDGSFAELHTFKGSESDGFYYVTGCGRLVEYSVAVRFDGLPVALAMTSHVCQTCLPGESVSVDLASLPDDFLLQQMRSFNITP